MEHRDMLRVSKFIDELLVKYYRMKPYFNATTIDDMVGQFVVTLAPHTSAGVFGENHRIHRRARRAFTSLCHISKKKELRR